MTTEDHTTCATDEHDHASHSQSPAGLSRRSVLFGTGAAGVAALGAGLAAGVASGQESAVNAPAINTGSVEGLTYKAFIRRDGEPHIIDVRLNALDPRHVLIRTEASCGCYTSNGAVLRGGGSDNFVTIPNHSGFGTVVSVGEQVHRVQIGDRVLVSGTSQCGVCYQCLHGAPEACNYLGLPVRDIGVVADDPSLAVRQAGNIGGFSEYMVALEEYCVPCFSDLPSDQLCMLGDTFGAGYAATTTFRPVTFGQDVIIFGAGPIGLAAIEGARSHAAGQIIVIEPIPYRRDKAIELGATTVIDPNEIWGAELTAHLKDMCSGPTDRIDAGGRYEHGFFSPAGADLVVECSGGDYEGVAPIVEGPDPTGVEAIVQAYDATRGGGATVLMSGGHMNTPLTFPSATLFSLSTRAVYGGQMGGQWVMRDNARLIRAVEAGHVNIETLITRRVPLSVEGLIEGYTGVADRSELGVVIMPELSA